MVRHPDEGMLTLASGQPIADARHHFLSCRYIKITCRFVREQNGRAFGQGLGDRNPLPLTTGELHGVLRQEILDTLMVSIFWNDPIECFLDSVFDFPRLHAQQFKRIGKVLPDSQIGQKRAVLEGEAEVLGPQGLPLLVGKQLPCPPNNFRFVRKGPMNSPFVGPLQGRQQVHQGTLATAAAPGDRQKLLPLDKG